MITSLADAQQCCLASSRMFSGNQSKPGGQIFGSPELAPIARAGNERGRHQRANSRNGHQSASAIVATRQSFNLPRDLGNALFEFNQIIEQPGDGRDYRSAVRPAGRIVESGVARRVSTLEAILMRLWAAEMSGSKRAGRVRLQFQELVPKNDRAREILIEEINRQF